MLLNLSHFKQTSIWRSLRNLFNCSHTNYLYSKTIKNVSGFNIRRWLADEVKDPGLTYHKPNNFERRILVWTKKYPSFDEVPAHIPQDVMEKARNKMRIYINLGMVVATILGCILMIVTGRRAAERGESVHKMNLDWHKQINEESKKK